MTHNDGFSGENSQFVLSYELLCLLRWFVDHDADKLKKLITKAINEQAVKKAVEKNLMPAIDQIDSTICDDATVRFSIEKAATKIDHNPMENPKELLFKELLKRWKQSNKK